MKRQDHPMSYEEFSASHMNKPKVSIVTPTLNRAALIERTIRSVLAQTYDNVEYIIIDGGSRDDTLEILEKYAKKGKLKYVSEPDNGMYDAINKGLEMSSGDILGYLNSDDMYFPWTISTVVDAFLKNQGDLICGDTLVQDLDGHTIRINIWPAVSASYLRAGFFIAQPTVFIKKEVFLGLGGFGKEVKWLADCEYWLRAVEAGYKIKNLHELLAIECNHEETIRVKLRRQIDAEKAFLRSRYKPRVSNGLLLGFYSTFKFFQREMLYIVFRMLLDQKGEGLSKWRNFRKYYFCKFNLVNYYVSKAKIANLYHLIWHVSEREIPFQFEPSRNIE